MTLYIGNQKVCLTNNTGEKLTDYLNLGSVSFEINASYTEDGEGFNYIQISSIRITDYDTMEVITGKSFINSPYDSQFSGYTWTSDDTTLSLPVYTDINTDYVEIDDGMGSMYKQLLYPFAIVGYGYVENWDSGELEYQLGIYITNQNINGSLLVLGGTNIYLST
jgi:hypothetical protein